MTVRTLLSAVSIGLLGACASAPSSPTPAPPPPPPAEAPAPPPADPSPPAQTPSPATATAPPPAPSAPDSWHLLDEELDGVPGASVERAYGELLAGRAPARTVVVAVIDGGVDTAHVDLRDNLWRNPDEIAGNGVDDDGNGLVDDMFGWNFLGGADGTPVEHDTYEVTRLYVGCTGEGAALAVVSERYRCEDIAEDFRDRQVEAQELFATVSGLSGALAMVLPMLRDALQVDSLTPEAVSEMRPVRQDLLQAQGFYLQLTSNGITPGDVDEAMEQLEGQIRFNLNPDFDPRPVVGDHYEDLDERVYGNADVTGPDASHGTHVAGIIGAVRGNDVGMDGAADGVQIMALRAVPQGDEHDKDVANAIRYAVDHGAHIINMSFGKAYSPQKEVVDQAVRYADSLGVLMVHAAGNDGEDLGVSPSYPTRDYLDGGRADLWIEVGASGWNAPDSLAATFSNYGQDQVDLFAPGVDILSTVPGDEVRRQQGTSMAAPLVSGVAALLMAYFPDLTAAQVRDILLETATSYDDRAVARPGDGMMVPFGTLSRTGAVLNARAAVERAEALAAGGR